MKLFFRTLASVLLFSMLAAFCLWRQEVINMEQATAFVKKVSGTAQQITALTARQGTESEDNSKTLDGKKVAPPPQDTGGNYTAYDLSEELDPALENAICQGLAEMKSEIDISSFNLTREAVDAAINYVRFSHPEFFYVSAEYSIGSVLGKPSKYMPRYDYSASEAAAMQVTYQQKLDEITAGAPAEGTEFDKILYLHDYFVKNYCYDYTYTIRDAYTFFTKKTGVCQAYMLAMIAAAGELGIESVPVTSEVMNHAWNLVKIDGSWYHMDVTWDDSMSISTFTSYTYFLQSGRGLAAIDSDREDGHRDWVANKEAENTKYDNVSWRDTLAPLVKAGDTYYATAPADPADHAVRGVVYAGTDVTNMEAQFNITGGYWLAGTTGYYPGCYSGLLVSGNRLYYNSGNTIYGRDLNTGLVVYTVAPVVGVGRCIYGLYEMKDGKIVFAAAEDPGDEEFLLLSCAA